MENPSFIALSSQTALTRQMEVLSNNLANMNTTGFKAERLVFTEMLAEPDQDMDAMGPMSFVEPYATYMDFSVGQITATGNPLDVALADEGFFAVQAADGTAYTRGGRFSLDANGALVNDAGLPVLGAGGGPVELGGSTQISVAADGTISDENGIVARLAVFGFDDPQSLKRGPGGLYTADGQQPTEIAVPKVVQGMIEGSNVSPILEMTRLIEVSRSYQRMQQIVESEHERQKQAIERLPRAA